MQKILIPKNILLYLVEIIKELFLTMNSSKTVLDLCQIVEMDVCQLEKISECLNVEGKKQHVRILSVCPMEVWDIRRKVWRRCKSRPMKGQEMCSSHTRQLKNSSAIMIQGVFKKYLMNKRISSLLKDMSDLKM